MVHFLVIFGLIVLGIFLSAIITVWKKIKADRSFDLNKFFGNNKRFWLVSVILAFAFALGIAFVEGFENVINTMGFAKYEDTQFGFVLLGFSIAITSDKTKLTGEQTLIKKD